MTVEIELDRGDKAETRSFEGNILTFLSPRAFAPGAPIQFSAVVGDHRRAFEGRSLSSRRTGVDRFEVRMRFVNLSRNDREALLAAIAS